MCRAGGFLKGQSFHHSIYIQISSIQIHPPRIPTLPGTAVVLCFLCTVIDATSLPCKKGSPIHHPAWRPHEV
jgi:hypothetical protein